MQIHFLTPRIKERFPKACPHFSCATWHDARGVLRCDLPRSLCSLVKFLQTLMVSPSLPLDKRLLPLPQERTPVTCCDPISSRGWAPSSSALPRDATQAVPGSCPALARARAPWCPWARFTATADPAGGTPFLTTPHSQRHAPGQLHQQLCNYRLGQKISTEFNSVDAQNVWCSSRVVTILPQNSWNTNTLGKIQSCETLCVQKLQLLKPQSLSKSEN